MPRPKPVVHGLYAWTPAYGYRYIHPANRRTFEWLEPVGKVFEKIDEDAEWALLRYDEQQFKVRPELFKELYEKPPFSFGDVVTTREPAHQGLVSDVFYDEATGAFRFQLVERKRKIARVFAAGELRPAR